MPTAANLIVALTLGAFPSNATTVPWPNQMLHVCTFFLIRLGLKLRCCFGLRQLMRQMMRQMMSQTSGRPS